MKEPDWAKLRRANEELEHLRHHGHVTREDWGRIFAMAEEAAGDHPEFLEGILMRGAELGFVSLQF